MSVQRIKIPVANGNFLVAEQNSDPTYSKEIFIGIQDANGVWIQDLAIVRNAYHYPEREIYDIDGPVIWETDKFEVLVYGNEASEDWTENYLIPLYKEEPDGSNEDS